MVVKKTAKQLKLQNYKTRYERYRELYSYSNLARHRKQMLRYRTLIKNLK